MNKLQLYITKGGSIFKSLLNLNPSEDIRRYVRDIRNDVMRIDYEASEINIFYLLTAIEDGVFVTIVRTIPPHKGHYLAAWIFVPAATNIAPQELLRIVSLTTRKVSNPEVTATDVADLRETFAAEYEIIPDAPAITASQLDGPMAWRAYGTGTGYTLLNFMDNGLWQQSYLPYCGVMLIDSDLRYDVEAECINDIAIGEPATILPPEENCDGFKPHVFGRALDRPLLGTLGAPLQVVWRRAGFDDIIVDETVNDVEFTPSPVTSHGSHKTITASSFYVTSQVSREPLEGCSIRVNGHEITATGHRFTADELAAASVLVSCDGYFPFSGTLNLASTTRALVQLQERRKIYRFELPVISSELGAPVKFEIRTKKALTDSPLEGYALLDEIQEGATRTNHLGYIGSGFSWASKALYAGAGLVAGILLTLVVTKCTSSPDNESALAPAANPDTIVKTEIPTVTPPPAPAPDAKAEQPKPEEPKAEESKAKPEKTAAESPEGLAKAVKYLDDNKIWNKNDMEKMPELKGLFDDMNNFRIERIIDHWGPKLKDSKNMQYIVEHAKLGKHKAKLSGTYNKEGDLQISKQGFANRIDP